MTLDLPNHANAAIGNNIPSVTAIQTAYGRVSRLEHALLHALNTFALGRSILLTAHNRKDTAEKTEKSEGLIKLLVSKVVGKDFSVEHMNDFLKLFKDVPEDGIPALVDTCGLELQRVNSALLLKVLTLTAQCLKSIQEDIGVLHMWGTEILAEFNHVSLVEIAKSIVENGQGFIAILGHTPAQTKWFEVLPICITLFGEIPLGITKLTGIASPALDECVACMQMVIKCGDAQNIENVLEAIVKEPIYLAIPEICQKLYKLPMCIMLGI